MTSINQLVLIDNIMNTVVIVNNKSVLNYFNAPDEEHTKRLFNVENIKRSFNDNILTNSNSCIYDSPDEEHTIRY